MKIFKFLTVLLAFASFSFLPTAGANDRTEPVVPHFDEPAPFCGSLLDVDLNWLCTPSALATVERTGEWSCPVGISDGRYDGDRYDMGLDPLARLSYNQFIIRDTLQSIEDRYGAFRNWCIQDPVINTVPTPTATAVPNPQPTAGCPDGFTSAGVQQGLLICNADDDPVVIAPAPFPIFTG